MESPSVNRTRLYAAGFLFLAAVYPAWSQERAGEAPVHAGQQGPADPVVSPPLDADNLDRDFNMGSGTGQLGPADASVAPSAQTGAPAANVGETRAPSAAANSLSPQEAIRTERPADFSQQGPSEKAAAMAAQGARAAGGLGTAAKKMEKAGKEDEGDDSASGAAAEGEAVFDKALLRPGQTPGKPASGLPSHKRSLQQEEVQKPGAESLRQDESQAQVGDLEPKDIKQFSVQQAQSSLTDLANGAYQAAAMGVAGKNEVGRHLKLLDTWDTYLKAPDQPGIRNFGSLKSDILRVQSEALAAGVSKTVVAPKIKFEKQGDVFVAILPPPTVSSLAQNLAEGFALRETDAMSSPLGTEVLIDPSKSFSLVYKANLWAGGLPYGRAPFLASARAKYFAWRYRLKVALAQFWHRISDAPIRWAHRTWVRAFPRYGLLPPSPDLEALKGLPELSKLKVLKASEVPGDIKDALGFLSRIERRYHFILQVLARSAPMTLLTVRELLSSASEMAEDYRKISTDKAGVKALADLSRRVAAESDRLGLSGSDLIPASLSEMVVVEEGPTLRHWSERIHAAALEALAEDSAGLNNSAVLSGRQFLAVFKTDGGVSVVYANILSPLQGGMIRLVSPQSQLLTQELERLGFAVDSRQNAMTATLDRESSLETSEEMSMALAQAMGLLRGNQARFEEPLSPGAVKGFLRLLSDINQSPKSAVNVAAAIQSFGLGLDASRFATVGEVQVGSRLLWAQAARREGRRPLSIFVLREPASGRIAYARAEAGGLQSLSAPTLLPLLAH